MSTSISRRARGLATALALSLAVAAALLATSCGVPEYDVPDVRFEGPRSIDAYLQAYLDAPYGPPSISVAIAVDGEIVLARAAGLADVEAGTPATPETTYRAYSISKGVTAIAALQLAAAGKLDLDDDIRAHVPAFPEKPWPVRLRHLLTHTSGIRHYRDGAGEISSQVEYPTLASSLSVFGDDPLEFEPGTGYRYTSFGFNLLTGAIESASGREFATYLDEAVFGPAGMTHSSLAIAGRTEASAQPYWTPGRFTGHGEIDELPNVSGRYGASGLVATPTDLVRLVLAVEDGTLLPADAAQRLFEVPMPDVAPGQALGWNRVAADEDDGEGEGGRTVVYRSGAGTGYTGLVEYLPEQGIVGAVLINQNQYRGRTQVLEGLLDWYAAQRDDG